MFYLLVLKWLKCQKPGGGGGELGFKKLRGVLRKKNNI